PGHGSIARGKDAVLARLRGDLDYLEKLESGVKQALGEGLDLAATRERLRGLGYPTRGANDAGLGEHLENVDFAYRGVAKTPA
ncbi:MAG TPA: hypothetical protein VFP10_06160, partial [Candidatus Eisenbacteria bacterium]|nr:hypothetical protein [Candidatus Eisenbacteria bacterium]